MAYASAFSHENETAQPGYYSVFLDRYKVKAELTATRRAAIHRYTFPKAEDAGFILDLDYSLQRQTNEEIELEVISDTRYAGVRRRYIGLLPIQIVSLRRTRRYYFSSISSFSGVADCNPGKG